MGSTLQQLATARKQTLALDRTLSDETLDTEKRRSLEDMRSELTTEMTQLLKDLEDDESEEEEEQRSQEGSPSGAALTLKELQPAQGAAISPQVAEVVTRSVAQELKPALVSILFHFD